MDPSLDYHAPRDPEASRGYKLVLAILAALFVVLILTHRAPDPAGTIEIPGLGRFDLNPVDCHVGPGDRLVVNVMVRRELPVAVECARYPLLEQMPTRRRS